MRHKLIILFLLISFVGKAQVYQLMPQYGYDTKRMNFDSTIQIPTFCGVPVLGSNKINKGALAFDSCNNRFYYFNPKFQSWDTIKSADASLFVKYTDTASLLLPYLRKGDTVSLSSRINDRVKYSDTSNMLSVYLRSIDTTDKWVNSVIKVNDTTIRVGKGSTLTDIVLPHPSSVLSATRLVTTVYNNTGSTILKGSVVYISGRHSSNLPTIALAEANNEANSYKTFAIVENDIPTSNSGIVIQAGNIGNLNLPTSTYTDGDILYLSPTVPGGYTTIKPLAPYHICKLGSVTRAHPTFGSIEIKIENGWQLDELSDVSIASVPADSTLLQFSRVDSLWHDVSPLVAIGNRYIKPSDTVSLSNRINTKLNISDTSSMLSPYLRKLDTASLSNRINLKLNISDSASMLSPYLRKADTTSLSNRINTKLNISDTANTWVTSVFRKTASDSVFFVKGGSNNFAFRDSTGASGWGLTGNSGTNAATNFLGTTDNVNLVFRRNNFISGIIDSTSEAGGNGGRTAFGFRANPTGTNSTAFGYKALWGSSGSYNAAFGNLSGRNISSGTFNTLIGNNSYPNGNGDYNSTLGYQTLNSSSGSTNTAIGAFALTGLSSGDRNIGIGFQAGFNAQGSNQIYINSLTRNSYSGDQTGSPFYAQQSTTVANQIVTLNGRVGINTISPSTSAGLEVSSTTQGFLQPRLTTTQMNAISTPATGLSVFNTTDSVEYTYRGVGGGWTQNIVSQGAQTITGQKTFNDIIFIGSNNSIRGNGSFYIDGPGLGGTIGYRANTHNMTGTLTGLTQINTGGLTVNGGSNTTSLITSGSGVTSFRIQNTKSGGGIWYFENNRNAPAGSLEISNDFNVSTGGLTIFPSRNVSIGSNTEVASARLNVESTTQGFMPPRMTTTQRDNITSPAAGLIIYNTTTNKHQGYNGTTWNDFY